jgi:hypothetical protein
LSETTKVRDGKIVAKKNGEAKLTWRLGDKRRRGADETSEMIHR